MSKLFSSPNQAGLPIYGGCGRNCCHNHSCNHPYNFNTPYGSPSAGEPYPSINTTKISYPCSTYCNPPKLYADTYNYLNQKLIQPVVKEVYDDLKSITPANTVMNDSMALGNQGSVMGQNNLGNSIQRYQTPLGSTNHIGPMQMYYKSETQPTINQSTIGQTPGMGPEIVNMMMSRTDDASKVNGLPQVDTTSSMSGRLQNTERKMQHKNGFQIPSTTPNYMLQPQDIPQLQQNTVNNNIESNSNIMYHGKSASFLNPVQTTARSHHSQYGVHSQGVKKFNELFPGVTQGFGGDLGFDPMAIAINMNPANQQSVAMNNSYKLMGTTGINRSSESCPRPALTETNASATTFDQNAQFTKSEVPHQAMTISNQFQAVQQQQSPEATLPHQQAMYIAPIIGQPEIQNRAMHIPYTEDANSQQNNNEELNYNIPSQNSLVKELISPIDVSPNGKMNLTQTLTPQSAPPRLRAGQNTFSKVKPTISKTSIIGNTTLGKTSSKNQLQALYNQYKDSNSYTQPNINQYAKNANHSDGKLNLTQQNHDHLLSPIEHTGGDDSNTVTQNNNKFEKIVEQAGDTAFAKSSGDNVAHEQVTMVLNDIILTNQ